MKKLPKGKTTLICESCGSEFLVKNSLINYRNKLGQNIPRFCSVRCNGDWQNNRKKETCSTCGTLFVRRPQATDSERGTERVFCSAKCYHEYRKGRLGKCDNCGKQIYIQKGLDERYSSHFCSNKCRLESQFMFAGFAPASIEYHKFSDRIRKSNEGRTWKSGVLERDKICVMCNKKKSVCAHHIIPLGKIARDNHYDETAIKQDRRFNDLSNGEGLCYGCHAKKHGTTPVPR